MNLTTHQTKNNHAKGFSLIEVIIAIGIVSILLSGFLGVFGRAQRNITNSISSKDASLLKGAIETEFTAYRDSDTTAYTSAFDKAYNLIKASSTQATATLIYQYKAELTDNDNDGILPAYSGTGGIAGRDFIIQVAVRNLQRQNAIIQEELAPGIVTGSVYVAKMTQLRPTVTGDLQVSNQPTKIFNDNTETNSSTQYEDAVLTFQTELYKLPSNSAAFVTGATWNFTNIGNPVSVTNMAVRR